MDYTKAIELCKEYNAKVESMLMKLNAELHEMFGDKYIPTPLDCIDVGIMVDVDELSISPESSHKYNGDTFYTAHIDGIEITEVIRNAE